MSQYNESSFGNRYYFEVEWGVAKRIYLDKFSFGDEFFNSFELNRQPQLPRNPVYIYPNDNMLLNPLVKTFEEFYVTGSLFPRCSIGAEFSVGRQLKTRKSFWFHNVRILVLFGDLRRHSLYYKFRYDNFGFH